MKNTLIPILTAALLLFQGCADNLPEASFDLYQIEKVSATAGDECATLQWELQDGKSAPLDFLVSWIAGSLSGVDGEQIVSSSQTGVTIENLVNDCSYTFSVQPRYKGGLAQKVSTTCTPKSTRIPASGIKAMAGDSRIYVTWTAPDTQLDYKYQLTVSADGAEKKEMEVDKTETSKLIEGLTNSVEYTISLTCVYTHGVSPTIEAKATPGEIDAITVTATRLIRYQLCTFEYNPAYFVQGEIESVKWEFGDGSESTSVKALYSYREVGTYTVTLTVNYKGGLSEQATTSIIIEDYAWASVSGVGYQKANNIVFSHDGQTLYTASTSEKKLIAIDAINGTINWSFATEAQTYGAGPVVGPDGTIYFGTEDSEGTLYAISASGAQRWKKTLGSAVKAAPAITSDGVLYALNNSGTLYALDATSGNEKWKTTLAENATASGIAVDAEGAVYAGTSKGIWAFTENGTKKWQSADAHNVTERGGSLAICGNLLYATLKKGGGCVAVNITDGTTKWKDAKNNGDCYHPVVDAEGTVYFCEKAGYLYTTKADGTEKWSDTKEKNYIYSGFAIAADGKAYIAQYASPFSLLSFDSDGTRTVAATIGVQSMSSVSIGPDGRVYYGTNGSISTFEINTELAAGGWPMRGCNLQGTNSLK